MREMDIGQQQLVVSIDRRLRHKMDVAARARGVPLSVVVREALENAYGKIRLTREDREAIAGEMQAAYLRRQEIRRDRRLGVKRPNGRPPKRPPAQG